MGHESDEPPTEDGLDIFHSGDSTHLPHGDDELTVLLERNELTASDSDDGFTHPEFPTRLGRFIVCEPIACGGMAIVVRAQDKIFRRDVACKLLLKEHASKPRLVERFLLEAQLTANLQHPGIVPVYEFGRLEDDRPFFTMKLIKGQTLQNLLQTEPTNTSHHLQIFERVCQTLAYSHSKGIVHLDLKPGNIMVGSFGQVHLMDWGLARICDSKDSVPFDTGPDNTMGAIGHACFSNVSATNQVDGTPLYMSPEQARGETVDLRSDVFGLGAILCKILTGEPLYGGTSTCRILKSAATADLSLIHHKLERVGADKPMVRLAQRCISVDPANRPSDAGVVSTEVTAYVESMLKEGMKDWHRFFEISLDLFCVASFEGFFLRVNGNFSRVLGYPESALISCPFIDYVHPDDLEQTALAMRALLSGQPVERFRNRYRSADGVYLTLEWSAKSVLEERTIFAVARDVTNSAE